MYEVTMPKLSDSMEEGKIIKWRVKEGDAVHEGDVLAEIESDKAAMELECFHDGRMARVVHGDGAEVQVGEVIAYIAGKGETVEAAPAPGASVTSPRRQSGVAVGEAPTLPPQTPPSPAAPPPEPRIAISPYARKLAEARGIDYLKIEGSGPHGRIMAEDIEKAGTPQGPKAAVTADRSAAAPAGEPDMEPLAAALIKRFRLDASSLAGTGPDGLILVEDVVATVCGRPASPAAKPPDEDLPPLEVTPDEADVEDAPYRLKTQARRVTAAKHVIPHFYVTCGVDVTRLLEKRAELKATIGATVTHLVTLACLKTLQGHPEINQTYDRGKVIRWKAVNLGFAVQTDQGLTVPVLAKADRLSLAEIVGQMTALTQKARDGKLSPDQRRHPTFTISNLGMFDVEEFAAILNPPSSMTLAVASSRPAPVIRNGGIYIGQVMKLTASCDHRIIDGVMAARFLQDLKALLENPDALLAGAGA